LVVDIAYLESFGKQLSEVNVKEG